MSINLVDLAKQAIAGQVMDQLGGFIGADRKATESAVNAGIPAILGGLLGKASSPQGASDVLGSLQDFDGGILDNLGGLIGGGQESSMVEKGIKLLTMLFGSKQSSLIDSIGQITGLGNSSTGSLLGMLAPVIMGLIRKQSPASGFSAGGLTDLLMSQKDHIASAMPQGLSSQLGLGDLLGQGGEAVSNAVSGAADSARTASHNVESAGGGLMKTLLPLAVLGLLAWAAFSFLGGKADAVGDGATAIGNQVEAVTEQAGAAMDVTSVTNDVTSMFGGLTKSISSITDAESAKAAATEINDSASMWDTLNLDALPGPAKSTIGGVVGDLITKLESALEVAYKIPGVQAILEPAIGPLMKKIEAFAG